MSFARDHQPLHRSGLRRAVIFAVLLLLFCPRAYAVTLDALDPSRTYHVDALHFSGNQNFSDSDLRAAIATKARPFYALWQKRPAFDPQTFTNDLNQLQLFYESHGYYDAHISYDLEIHGDSLSPLLTIHEGHPVNVDSVAVEIAHPAPSPQALQPDFSLPLKPGQIFTQPNYQSSAQDLITVYRQNGYPHPDVERRAVVRTGPHLAKAWYHVAPHARGIFGVTTVAGTHKVNPRIVMRELAYQAGQRFDVRKIEQSRTNILNLNLFSAVEFTAAKDPHNRHIVPISIVVQEKPQHSLNLALGYNTQTQLNAQLGWNDYNFLGDGRQLLITGTYSQITTALDVELIQPHFFSRDARLTLEAAQAQESYQTYLLNASRFDPHR